MLGKAAAAELSVQMGQFDNGTVARIELQGQEALDYQKARWPS